MANQLIPPPGMGPPALHRLTPAQRWELWVESMDLAHEMLMAGLRRKVGPDGDVAEAYRQWYAREKEQHDAVWRHMAAKLAQAGVSHGQPADPAAGTELR